MNRFRQILAGQSPDQAATEASRADSEPTPRNHPFDPRPDLEDPGRLWKTVLATAYAVYGMSDIYTFLQGLRILECRLHLKPDGRLHLDTKPALESGWAEPVLRQQWLLPRKEQIKDVFARAEASLRGLPPGSRVPA